MSDLSATNAEFAELCAFDNPFDQATFFDWLLDFDALSLAHDEQILDTDFEQQNKPYVRLVNLIHHELRKGRSWPGLVEIEHFYLVDTETDECFHLTHYKGLRLVTLCVSSTHCDLLSGDTDQYDNDACALYRIWSVFDDVLPEEVKSDPGYLIFLSVHPNFRLLSYALPLLPWENDQYETAPSRPVFNSQALPLSFETDVVVIAPCKIGICHPPSFVRVPECQSVARCMPSSLRWKSCEDPEFINLCFRVEGIITPTDDIHPENGNIIMELLAETGWSLPMWSPFEAFWARPAPVSVYEAHATNPLFEHARVVSGKSFFMPSLALGPLPDLELDEDDDSEDDDLLDIANNVQWHSQALPVTVELNEPQFVVASGEVHDFNETLRQLADEGLTHKIDPEQLETFTEILKSVQSTFGSLSDTIKSTVSSLATAGSRIKNVALLVALAYAAYKVYTERDTKWTLGLTVVSVVCSFNFAPSLMQFVQDIVDRIRARQGIVSQSLSDISEVVKSLVVGCISYEMLGSVPNAKSVVAFGKRMADLPKTIEGFDTFITYLHSVIEKAFRFVSSTVFGRDVDYLVKTEVPAVDRWCESILAMAKLHHEDDLPLTVANYEKLTKLECEHLRLSKEVYSGLESHRVRLALTTYSSTLKKILLPFERKSFRKTGYRQEPLCILLMGPPGVGKSVTTWPLIMGIMKQCATEDELANFKNEYANRMYSRQPVNEYWEGYEREWATVHDDFGQKRDSIGDATEPLEFIAEVNTYPFMTHQADIESKGKKEYTSKLVLLTTNRFAMDFVSIHDINALLRRMHIPAIQSVKAEYAVDPDAPPEKRKLNMNHPHVVAEGGKIKLDILEYHLIEFEDATKYRIVGVADFWDFLTLCIRKFKEKEGKAQLMKDFLDDIAEKGIPLRSQAGEDPERMDSSNSAWHPDVEAAMRDYAKRHDVVVEGELDLDQLFSHLDDDPGDHADTYMIGLSDDDYDTIDEFRNEFFPRYRNKVMIRGLLRHKTIIKHNALNSNGKDTIAQRNRRLVRTLRLITPGLRDKHALRTLFIFQVEKDIDGIWAATRGRLTEARSSLTDWITAIPGMISFYFNRLLQAESRFNNHLLMNYPVFWSAYTFMKAFLLNLVIIVPVWIGVLKLLEWLFIPAEVRKTRAWKQKKDAQYLKEQMERAERLENEAKEEALLDTALAKGIDFTGQSSNKDKTMHRARRAVLKGRNRAHDPQFYSESGGDVNLAEMMKKVSLNNVYILYYPNGKDSYSKEKAGQLTVLSGHAAILPYHYCSIFKHNVDTGRWTPDTKIKLVSNAEFEVPVKYFLKETRTNHFKRNDLYVFELPKTMPTHANITKYFCTEAQLSSLIDPYGGLWLAYDDWTYNPAMRIRIAESGFTVSSGIVGDTDLDDVYIYRCPTKDGDCGGLLTINDRSIGPGKILGIHTAGTSASEALAIGMSSRVSYENVVEAITLLSTESPQFPLPTEVDLQCLSIPEQTFSKGFPIIGAPIRPVFGAPSTKIRPSALHGLWGPPKKGPARLCRFAIEGKVVHPLEEAIQKYRRSLPVITVDPPLDVFRHAARLVMQRSFKVSTYDEDMPMRILTIEEACFGLEGVAFMDSIPKSTSPGYPYTMQSHPGYPGKTWWLGIGDEKKGPGWNELVHDVDVIISAARKGERVPVYFTDFLKDELRSLEKVHIGKTRLISGSWLPYLVAFRMWFLPFMAWYRRNMIMNMCAVGMNPYSQQWHVLSKLLRSKGPKAFDADFAGLDTSHFHGIFVLYAEFANLFFEDGEENALVRRVLMEYAAYSTHVAGGEVYLWACVEPSGFPATTDFNSFAVLCLLVACWIDLNPDGIAGGARFFEHVYAIVFGDDHVVNISDYCSEFYNQTTLVGAMLRYGYVYTDANKNSNPDPWKPLAQCTFLKRGFRLEARVQRVICPLELDTILEMPYWFRKGPNDHESQIQTVDTALKELSLHDPGVWDRFAPQILKASKNHLAHISEFDDRSRTQTVALAEDYVW